MPTAFNAGTYLDLVQKDEWSSKNLGFPIKMSRRIALSLNEESLDDPLTKKIT